MEQRLKTVVLALIASLFIQASNAIADVSFVYYNSENLIFVKKAIKDKNAQFTSAYDSLIESANRELPAKIDPVVNKTLTPPSGDKHDYISLAPYFWDNPDTPDGLPWVRKDGQVNPKTRGKNTDQARAKAMLKSLKTLTFAYYFSDEKIYATKAKKIIDVWFINPKTKMNPNLNYAQGIPGVNDGRPFGIIEWENISSVVSAMELLDSRGMVNKKFKRKVDNWLKEYLTWLLTSELGKLEDTRVNNHASWYDYQAVGLLLYLGKEQQAKQRVEAAKKNRIAIQIEPDGKQPMELKRIKSVSYSSMNLLALSHVTDMGRKVGVDLWSYKTKDGRSLKQAANFLKPSAT